MRARSVGVVAAVGLLHLWLAAIALPAHAGTEHTLTLEAASPTTVTFGQSVHLVGKLTPGAIGEQITLRDHDGKILASTKTVKFGKFSVDYAPRDIRYVHAEWDGLHSNPVRVKARPRVTAGIANVFLFGTATVRGQVAPWDPGAPAAVTVFRDGTRALQRTVTLGASSSFHFTMPVSKPGAYSVHVVYDTPSSMKGVGDSPRVATPLPPLARGSHGRFVSLLEHRLASLHYRIVNVNETYDSVTADAVMAFRKVQGMSRVWSVDAGTWRALASPRLPHPRVGGSGFHVEIDQTRQVIYTVQDGAIAAILHTSTGKTSTPTRDGSFSVHRKVAGFSVGHLYYPSYFDGNRAVHGWTEVPPYAASHGCARIPYWNAKYMYDRKPIGTRVIVYHS
jgi:hypothetical protein